MISFTKRTVSVLLVGSLLTLASVPLAHAEEPQAPAQRSANLSASIDRAAAQIAAQPVRRGQRPEPSASREEVAQMGGGGGGGHVGMIISIVGAVAGAATTYYVVKQMQKTTANLPTKQ